jgi:hypothetical protein
MCGLMTASTALSQPFDIPVPNVPDDVLGLNPALRITFGSHEWGDFNGDGEMDFVMVGRLPVSSLVTVPLFGDVFRSSPSRPELSTLIYNYFGTRTITPMWLTDAAWGDYDNDGDLDLVVQGATSVDDAMNPETILYRSTGNQIVAVDGVELIGLYGGSVDWGDYDMDGDLDLALSGVQADGRHLVTIYKNDGPGQFTEIPTSFVSLAYGDLEWVDFDGDGDLDLFVSGSEEQGQPHALIYRNEGSDAFSDSGQDLPGVSFSSSSWGDFDSDGDPDLVLSGYQLSPLFGSGVTRLFRNDAGLLSEVAAQLPGIYYGDIQWVDFDRDGDLDIVLSGRREAFGSNITQVCSQGTGGAFVCGQIQLFGLGAQPVPGLAYGNISMADYDHDSDLDLLVMGDRGRGDAMTTMYRNAGFAKNLPPLQPTGLQSTVTESSVELSWEPAVDPNSPSPGLMYSVRVGTTSGGVDIASPHANPVSGQRYLLDEGNAGHGTQWRLEGLAPGTYYWSVQAIDNSFAGSPFAVEQTFSIGA